MVVLLDVFMEAVKEGKKLTFHTLHIPECVIMRVLEKDFSLQNCY